MSTDRDGGPAWLLLIHQLPAKPAYARVKVWRRLQALGAVTVKNAVYALPDNSETREDFAWLAKEIVESGGEALVCEAELVEGLTDERVAGAVRCARATRTTQRIAAEARELAAASRRRSVRCRAARGRSTGGAAAQAASTRSVAIDFFGADGRDAAEGSWSPASKPDCSRRMPT